MMSLLAEELVPRAFEFDAEFRLSVALLELGAFAESLAAAARKSSPFKISASSICLIADMLLLDMSLISLSLSLLTGTFF